MLAVSILVSLLTFVCLHYYFKYTLVRRKLNLDGPTPWPIMGNLITMATVNREKNFKDWRQKYGRVYAVFFAAQPQIVVSDREVVRQITIRDFDTFTNHSSLEAFFDKNLQEHFVFSLRDEDWYRVRAIMSPTFTSLKVRTMFPKLNDACDDMISNINEQIDELNAPKDQQNTKLVLNTDQTLQLFSLDSISSCCYAMSLRRKAGEHTFNDAIKRDTLARALAGVFNFDNVRSFLVMTLPRFLHPLLYEQKTNKQFEIVKSIMYPIIEKRSKETDSSKHNDYLQALINARLGDKLELSATDDLENHHASLTASSLNSEQEKNIASTFAKNNGISSEDDNKQPLIKSGEKKSKLSLDEMLINAVSFLFVGLDSASATVTAAIYTLAFHQKVQNKLFEEVSKLAKIETTNDGKHAYKFDYESLTACAYLDSVISETLRLFGPAPSMDRQAKAPYTIEKYNVTLPRGSIVMLPFMMIHRDPEYWPEPEVFNPERFMPENRSKILAGSYLPFGMGPRYCVGMRFALSEMKLALANLSMHFVFTPKEGTSWPLVSLPGHGIPKYDCTDVYVERRPPIATSA